MQMPDLSSMADTRGFHRTQKGLLTRSVERDLLLRSPKNKIKLKKKKAHPMAAFRKENVEKLYKQI